MAMNNRANNILDPVAKKPLITRPQRVAALEAFVTSFDGEFKLPIGTTAKDAAEQWDNAMTASQIGERTKMLYNTILVATVVSMPMAEPVGDPITNALVEPTTSSSFDVGETAADLIDAADSLVVVDAKDNKVIRRLQALSYVNLTDLAAYFNDENAKAIAEGADINPSIPKLQSWIQSEINRPPQTAAPTPTYPVGSSEDRLEAFKGALTEHDMEHGSVPFPNLPPQSEKDEEFAWTELQIKFVFTGWLSNKTFVELKELIQEGKGPIGAMHGLTELKRQITNFTNIHENSIDIGELPNYTNPVKDLVKEQLLNTGVPIPKARENSIIKELIKLYETIIKINGEFEAHMEEQVRERDSVHSAYLLLIKSIQEKAWKTADYDAAKIKILADAAIIAKKEESNIKGTEAIAAAEAACAIRVQAAEDILTNKHAAVVLAHNAALTAAERKGSDWENKYNALASQIIAVQTTATVAEAV